MPSNLDDIPTVMPLPAGQALRLQVAAGTVLHALTGEMALAGPMQWLAGHCHMPRRRLRTGDTWIVPERGWLTVSASQSGALSVTVPPGWLARLRARLALPWRGPGPASRPAPQRIPDPARQRR
ncbi:hypothetical protein VSR17_02830 [Cupriavidus taiwanensis]|uniref:DUF2917 domain-containing protein n=1 Tax=Cupriavidus taiwanensis TaxID=164546 RepID=A0A375IG09_9BURK|nr:hypothetical protein [Cupriavidus taiwanensis]SOY56331.1 conserved hypothetical protein [Cupriavidus taiwanensis]SOY57006.1 conserved hypothetical protein [Cupriavidus taiwanensis]SOY91080.1 conserved hypothetical protein [Cupriavidus taiwanensis]SOZ25821.1 conserved hypothetical protein [Cupriavidus taiwanensis]SOZ63889.1 conserved hypothetical protein [Cupriavidus taiwanensis]